MKLVIESIVRFNIATARSDNVLAMNVIACEKTALRCIISLFRVVVVVDLYIYIAFRVQIKQIRKFVTRHFQVINPFY